MRSLVVLAVLVGFVAAVIMPNEIGTDHLPAVGAKHVTAKTSKHSVKPVKNGPAVCIVLEKLRSEPGTGESAPAVCRSPRTASNTQLNLPLLI